MKKNKKKPMRNGAFLSDHSNKLANMLGLPFGRIMMTGIDEQIGILTQDNARLYLGAMSGIGEISFKTAGRILGQVEYAHIANNIAEVAKRVEQFQIPRDYRPKSNFVMRKDGLSGHFRFRGLHEMERLVNPIDSFEFGVEFACDLVAEDKATPMEAVVALQQIIASCLPIDDRQIRDRYENSVSSFLAELFGGSMVEVNLADDIEPLFGGTRHQPPAPRTDSPPPAQPKPTNGAGSTDASPSAS